MAFGPPPSASLAAAAASAAALPAFEDVYRRFAAMVHGVALAHVGPSDADDVVQEVFLRVAQRLGSLRDVAALPGWLATTARNAARDRLRRRRRAPAPLPDDGRQVAARASPEARDELRHRVLALLARLPETYREALVLRLVEGLDGPAIASLTGLTLGSVRVHLFRGLELLRPLLRQEGW